MEPELKLEIKGRTLRLSAYDTEKALLDAAELRLKRLFSQSHEYIKGRRVKLTNRRKIAKAKVVINQLFSDDIDITQDAINMLKLFNK